MANGMLLVGFDYSDAQVDEFNDWYDLEHIPERQSVTGFGACQRWVDQSLNYSVATYELATVNVLDSESYLAIAYDNLSAWSKRVTAKCKRLVRFEGTLINGEQAIIPAEAGGLLVNAMNVAPQHEDDFNAWYDQEHLPALCSVPGTLSAYRYRGRPSSTHRYLAIYYLEHPEVAHSSEWKAAATSPWSDRVRPHFKDRVRILAHRYTRNA